MENATPVAGTPPRRSDSKNVAVESRVYYVSDRPEAYEIGGEVGYAEARAIGELIAARAARHFPGIEFKVDSAWHSHQHGMERVAAYIEDHWQEWVAASQK